MTTGIEDDPPRDIQLVIALGADRGFTVTLHEHGNETLLVACSSSAELAGWVSQNLHMYDRHSIALEAENDDTILSFPRFVRRQIAAMAQTVTGRKSA